MAISNPDEYARVVAENDWTLNEAAKYPKRLVALCSLNPLRTYAIRELARCGSDPRFGPANLLWRAGQIVVLDFDKCALGDPAQDLGNLLCHV